VTKFSLFFQPPLGLSGGCGRTKKQIQAEILSTTNQLMWHRSRTCLRGDPPECRWVTLPISQLPDARHHPRYNKVGRLYSGLFGALTGDQHGEQSDRIWVGAGEISALWSSGFSQATDRASLRRRVTGHAIQLISDFRRTQPSRAQSTKALLQYRIE
jgi:hypothetical protein